MMIVQPTIDLNLLRQNYDRADGHYEYSDQDPDVAAEAFYHAYEYISGLESENTRKDTIISQQAEYIASLEAERNRLRAERDGLWNVAGRAVNERQRDQRLTFGRED